MVVDIDINKLIKLGISAEEYFLLRGVQKRGYASLERYYRHNPAPSDEMLKSLVKKKLIHDANKGKEFSPRNIIVRSNFISDTKNTLNLFNELYNLYPTKVTRPDGSVDYLRTDKTRCRRSYAAKLKDGTAIHENVMECLKFEIQQRESEGSLSYMKRLPKWLASEEWLTWDERRNDNIELTDNFVAGYGLKLE